MSTTEPVEWFPVVDEDGNVIGEAPRHICHDGKSFLLHPVVHLFVFNKKGEILLQKRSATKDVQPGKWDTSVGGHVSPGETVEDALNREALEELGLQGFVPVFVRKYIWKSAVERELVNSFSTTAGNNFIINRDEIEEARFWSVKEITENFGKEIFTPNFEHEFKINNGWKEKLKNEL